MAHFFLKNNMFDPIVKHTWNVAMHVLQLGSAWANTVSHLFCTKEHYENVYSVTSCWNKELPNFWKRYPNSSTFICVY